MTFQRGNQSTYRNSQNAENTSMFASRPAVIQTQHSQLASTAEEIEQQKFDANKLENQNKFGTESLGVFPAKDNFWNQKTSRFNHDFSSIPVHSPNTVTQRIIQPQLTIGKVGDKYEQEADKVAADVVNRMHQPENEKVQRQEIEEDEELQRKAELGSIQRQELPEDEDKLQMKPIVQRLAGEGGMAATPDSEASIQQARGSGQPLAENVQKPMEKAFWFDFSRVKVHTNPHSDRLNQSIQAKAFTTGRDIFFRQGAYDPGSCGGQELIAHELTHVVQQTGNAVQKAGNNGRESRVNLQRMKKENDEEVVIQGKFVNVFGDPLNLSKAGKLIEDFKKSAYYLMFIRSHGYTEQEINDALDAIEIEDRADLKIVVQGVHNDPVYREINDKLLRVLPEKDDKKQIPQPSQELLPSDVADLEEEKDDQKQTPQSHQELPLDESKDVIEKADEIKSELEMIYYDYNQANSDDDVLLEKLNHKLQQLMDKERPIRKRLQKEIDNTLSKFNKLGGLKVYEDTKEEDSEIKLVASELGDLNVTYIALSEARVETKDLVNINRSTASKKKGAKYKKLIKMDTKERKEESKRLRVEGRELLDEQPKVPYLTPAQREHYKIKPIKENGETIYVDENNNPVDTTEAETEYSDGRGNGEFIFVMSEDGELYIADENKETEKNEGTFHHSSFLAGKPVAAAGTIAFSSGKVTRITNVSGHYRPDFYYSYQVLLELKSQNMDIRDVEVTVKFPEEIKVKNGISKGLSITGEGLVEFCENRAETEMTSEELFEWLDKNPRFKR